MSIAAHEPRRVDPRRADSHSESKVAPRRNAPETSESRGLQYDSDELPVLIRLPNLRELGSAEKPQPAQTHGKRRSKDRAAAGQQKSTQPDVSKVAKKPILQQSGPNKLVLGGIGGGILLVVVLLLFNASSPAPPADQDGWASEAAQLETLVQEPEVTFSTGSEPPPLYPGLATSAPETRNAEVTGSEYTSADETVPDYDLPDYVRPQGEKPRGTVPAETVALPSKQQPVAGWPTDEAMSLQSPAGGAPAGHWPDESLSLEQGGYGYPPTNSPSQTDNRSSMYPYETESFRMGKLNSDRPATAEGDQSSILDGNIEIPDTTSLR